jgi:hypothetical protein
MVHEKFKIYNFQIQLAAFSALALVIASFILTAMHPAAGEILSSLLIKVGLLINLALAGLSLLVLVGFAAWGFGKGINIRLVPVDNAPARLSAVSRSTDKDEFIILWPGGDEAEFLAKGLAAKEGKSSASPWKWSVLIAYRSTHVTICGDDVKTYCRDEAIFARPEWPDYSGRIAEPGTAFTTETPEQFDAFVRKFVQIFREWSQRVKAEQTAGKVGIPMLEILKHSANVALFLLLSVSAIFAQSKTRQVDNILGTRIREIPPAGADVSFIFEGDKTYNRIGDGKSDYTSLLQKSPGIGKFNDEGGVLIAVTKDGEVIAKAARAERVNATPATKAEQMRPVPVDDAPPVAVMDRPAFAVPDSLAVADMMETGKEGFDYLKSEAWKMVKPVWGFVAYVALSVFPLLFCLAGLFKYFSGTAAKEGFYGLSVVGRWIRGVHEAASGGTLIICWVITAAFLVNEFLWFVYLGWNLWAMFALWLPSIWIAKVMTNWFVPNPPGVYGSGGGQDIFTPINKQLPRG